LALDDRHQFHWEVEVQLMVLLFRPSIFLQLVALELFWICVKQVYILRQHAYLQS